MTFGIIDLFSLGQGGITGIGEVPYTAISFPLSMPTNKSPRRIQIRAASANVVTQSPYNFYTQVQSSNADMWLAEVELPPMVREDAEEWLGFLLTLQGQLGTFLLGDPLGSSPRGIATGTPLVRDAGQSGRKLATKGWTPSTTGILKAGDWIGLGQRGHKVLRDVDSNASGEAILDIYPRLREIPNINDPVTTENVKTLMRLAGSTYNIWSADETRAYSISFSAVEAL